MRVCANMAQVWVIDMLAGPCCCWGKIPKSMVPSSHTYPSALLAREVSQTNMHSRRHGFGCASILLPALHDYDASRRFHGHGKQSAQSIKIQLRYPQCWLVSAYLLLTMYDTDRRGISPHACAERPMKGTTRLRRICPVLMIRHQRWHDIERSAYGGLSRCSRGAQLSFHRPLSRCSTGL